MSDMQSYMEVFGTIGGPEDFVDIIRAIDDTVTTHISNARSK